MAPPSAPSADTASGFDLNTVPRPSLTKKAKVLYDYDAAEKNELSLLADEVSVVAKCCNIPQVLTVTSSCFFFFSLR